MFIYLHSFAGIVGRYYRLRLHRRCVRAIVFFFKVRSFWCINSSAEREVTGVVLMQFWTVVRSLAGGRIRSVTAAASSSAADFTPARFGWVLFVFILHPTDEAVLFNARAFSLSDVKSRGASRSEETSVGEPTSHENSVSFCDAELFHECGGRSLPCVYSACTPLKHTDTVCTHTQSTQQTGHSRLVTAGSIRAVS